MMRKRIPAIALPALLLAVSHPAGAACNPPVNSSVGLTQTCFAIPNVVLHRGDGDIYIELPDSNPTLCAVAQVGEHGTAKPFFRLRAGNPSASRIAAAAELTLMTQVSLALIARTGTGGICDVYSAYHGAPGQ